MDSRAAILQKVKKNKPSIDTNIDLEQFVLDDGTDVIQRYCESVVANAGEFKLIESPQHLIDTINSELEGTSFANFTDLEFSEKGIDLNIQDTPSDLKDTKAAVIPGQLGVAENAAVWLDHEILKQLRVAPFIVERTIFIVEKENIVRTMHDAYNKIADPNTSFGTFIAGPSKTADIEQNLVIGAHGTKSHLILIV
ncbi:MAG: LUD domain-containing protein [Cyclobacteriaceae bacterium]